MRRPNLKWTMRLGALGGLVALVLFLALQYAARQPGLEMYSQVHRLIRFLWPSAIWLMATEGIEGTPQGYFIVALSIGANALLYGLVAGILSLCLREKRSEAASASGPRNLHS